MTSLLLVGLMVLAAGGCRTATVHGAARSGSMASLRRHLNEGASINTVDPVTRATPLHVAAYEGHEEMVLFMIRSGADVNARDGEGNTPLHLAAEQGHDETVRQLVSAGSNATARNRYGKTPRDLAFGHPEITRELRDAGG